MNDQLYEEIGRRIREQRDKLNWTQQELSEKMNFTRSSIANIELGRQKIQIHILYEFSSVLGVSPFDLLPQFSEIERNSVIPVKTTNLDTESLTFLQRILSNKSAQNEGDDKNESEKS